MNRTSIPWTKAPTGEQGYSWNPTSGCNGPNGVPCPYCYARAMARRFRRSFEPTCHPEKLREPLRLTQPARIFVDSNGDLFDPAILDEFIERVFGVMALCQQHNFIVLTKQANRMAEWFRWESISETRETMASRYAEHIGNIVWDPRGSDYWLYEQASAKIVQNRRKWPCWPLPNVWLGTTAETQKAADERVPLLLAAPAAVRFVSVEPMLSAIDISKYLSCEFYAGPLIGPRAGTISGKSMPAARLRPRLDWVIIGEDSTPGAKMPDSHWVESLIDQCRAAGVPVFVKGKLAQTFKCQEWPH